MVDLLSRAPLNAQIIGSPEQTQFHMTWLQRTARALYNSRSERFVIPYGQDTRIQL